MQRTWAAVSVLLVACAGAQGAQPVSVASHPEGAPAQSVAAPRSARETKAEPPSKAALAAPSAAKTSPGAGQACTPTAGVAPKVVSGDASVSDVGETGQTLIFDVAGISLELPACTPEADLRVISVSWDTKDRPTAARIDPNFTRHAATLRVNHAISALPDAPLVVRLHSKRELAKVGEKLVLAVESSGDCDEQHKRDKLEYGSCSHWQLFDTTFDTATNEMVARIPATGGYRLQFGWVPAK